MVVPLPVWKTIKLGTGLMTADDFCRAIKKMGYHISGSANNILDNRAFTVADKGTEVDLVVISVADLDLNNTNGNGTMRKDIYRRAKKLGMKICPPEVGPQLRLQYQDQPMSELLVIGMKPINVSDGHPRLFRVERGYNGLWLDGPRGYSDRFWNDLSRWVFLLPRNT